VNTICESLTNSGWIKDGAITAEGLALLEPYRVKNAIIMAADRYIHFIPVAYENPVGLLAVKGELLIERQIRQLKKSGINDITIVVGYMKEKLVYLQQKFGVQIVTNEDYYRYGSASTLLRVADKIGNSYICSSDDYFTENIFDPYVYDSYRAAAFFKNAADEWELVTDEDGVITDVKRQNGDASCMCGQAYLTEEFAKQFIKLLREKYDDDDTKTEPWERLYARNREKLKMYMRKYQKGVIWEFRTLKQLRSFDESYIDNSRTGVFKNICNALNCRERDIQDIELTKNGYTNLSFKFSACGRDYVYRHPGAGTSDYIIRKSEAFAMETARRLGLDNTFICMGESGWKLSHYIKNARYVDPRNTRELKRALEMMKRLHDAKIKSEFDVDVWARIERFIGKLPQKCKESEEYKKLYASMRKLYEHTQKDKVEAQLFHGDCYLCNFLIGEDESMSLIDWEYSANGDPANDIGSLICELPLTFTYEDVLRILELYHGRKPTDKELRHELAYVVIMSYYWYVWGLYVTSLGVPIGDFMNIWMTRMKFYTPKVLELYGK